MAINYLLKFAPKADITTPIGGQNALIVSGQLMFNNKPLGAKVSAVPLDQDGEIRINGQWVVTDIFEGNSRFEFNNLVPGVYQLVFTNRNQIYLPVPKTFDQGLPSDILEFSGQESIDLGVINLRLAFDASGKVLSRSGQPLGGVKIDLLSLDNQNFGTVSISTLGVYLGTFTLNSLPIGTYRYKTTDTSGRYPVKQGRLTVSPNNYSKLQIILGS